VGVDKMNSRLTIVYESIEKIKPYKHNAKIHTEGQIEQIKKSIREFGFNDPIAVDEENVIIEGHGRLLAAKELGMKEVPVIFLYGLTDQQKKAYILAHNQLTMNTGFDMDVLADEINRITAFNMEDFGFDMSALGEEEKNPEDVTEDEPPEPPAKPKSKPGEIYKLGEHRLMCGDSTKAEDVERLMSGAKADLVVTDPPYNVEYVGAKKRRVAITGGKGLLKKTEIQNDIMSDNDFYDFLFRVFSNMKDVVYPRTAFYVWYADTKALQVYSALQNSGFIVRETLIWIKNSMVIGWYDYQYMHEPCLYGFNDYANHYFVNDRTKTTVIDDTNLDFDKMKKDELLTLIKSIFKDEAPTSVIRENKPQKSDLHPTMKPVKLIARLINNSSRAGELVLDLFGGSGTTLIACEQMNRKCSMMEYDPKYVDVIIERWEKLTGKKAQKIEG
jgi:DNA modification methylase